MTTASKPGDRIIIVGGSRTGKTTISRVLSRRGYRIRHTDELIDPKEPDNWHKASDRISHWFDEPGPWVIEGVSVVRGLRKWLDRNPGKPVPGMVARMTNQVAERSKGQHAISKGVETIWKSIEQELKERGAHVVDGADHANWQDEGDDWFSKEHAEIVSQRHSKDEDREFFDRFRKDMVEAVDNT